MRGESYVGVYRVVVDIDFRVSALKRPIVEIETRFGGVLYATFRQLLAGFHLFGGVSCVVDFERHGVLGGRHRVFILVVRGFAAGDETA